MGAWELGTDDVDLCAADSIFGARVLKILVSATVSHDPAAFALLDLYCPRLVAPSMAESKYSLPNGRYGIQKAM